MQVREGFSLFRLHFSAFRSCASAHSGDPRASWLNSVYPDCIDQQSLGMDQASATHHLSDRRASWLIPAQPGSLCIAHMRDQLTQHCCHQLCPLRSIILDGASSLESTQTPSQTPNSCSSGAVLHGAASPRHQTEDFRLNEGFGGFSSARRTALSSTNCFVSHARELSCLKDTADIS